MKNVFWMVIFFYSVTLPNPQSLYPTRCIFSKNTHYGKINASSYDITPYQFTLSRQGLPEHLKYSGESIIDSVVVVASDIKSAKKMTLQNVDIHLQDFGFFCRTSSMPLNDSGYCPGRFFIESYCEGVKFSSRLNLYFRSWVVDSLLYSLKIVVYLSSRISNLEKWLDGNIVLSTLQKPNLYDDTSRSFLNRQSVSIVPRMEFAQIRNWMENDFTIEKNMNVRIKIDTNNSSSKRLQFTIDSVLSGKNETLEYYLSFVGLLGDNDVQHYLSNDVTEKFGYYFPHEGYSTKKYSTEVGFPMLRKNGYSWGWATFANPYMEYLRLFPSDTLHGYFLDERIRHFVYFLERQSEYGLLPYTIMPDYLVAKTKHREKMFSDFMFAQAGVGDFDFATTFLPTLPIVQAETLFNKLNRVEQLFDPSSPSTWTVSLNESTYWFEYSNLWRSEGNITFTLNTHVTALRIALHQFQLSQSLSKNDETNYWETVFLKGLNGLFWYVQDPRNWGLDPKNNKKIIAYSKHGNISTLYHEFVFTEIRYITSKIKDTAIKKRIGQILNN